MIGLNHFLLIAAMLFALGLYTVLSRRNAIAILMGVELIRFDPKPEPVDAIEHLPRRDENRALLCLPAT